MATQDTTASRWRPPSSRAQATRRRFTVGAVAALVGAAALLASCDLTGGARESIEAAPSAPTTSAPTTTAPTTTAPTTTAPATTGPATAAASTPPQPDAPGLAPVIERIETDDPVVFLTIDDGATRDPEMVDQLAASDVPYTSFLTVQMADADRDFWRRSQQLGGTIQTHTIDHPDLRTLAPDELRRQVCAPLDDFEADYGTRPHLFRPPFGRYDDRVRAAAAECGYDAIVMWTGVVDRGQIALRSERMQRGDIILLHYRDDWREDLTAAYLAATASGLRFAQLEDYLTPTP